MKDSMLTKLTARTLLTETGQIDYPVVTVEDGRIVSIESGAPNGSTETLTAAFFDIHVHGACSHDFMTASLSEIRGGGAISSEARGWALSADDSDRACRCDAARAGYAC